MLYKRLDLISHIKILYFLNIFKYVKIIQIEISIE